jgi:hypothetical protein
MTLPWFRLYGETVDDAKLRLLAFEDRWHYIAILCCKSQGILDDTKLEMLDRMVAAKLGLAARELDEVRRRLKDVDLIGHDWQPHGWDRRQYVSDTSTERTRKYREKLKAQSEEEESKSKNRTDTEGDVTGNVTVTLHESLPVTTWQEWLDHRKRRRWPCDPTTLTKQLNLLKKFGTAEQTEIIDASINSGWQGLFAPKNKTANGGRRLTKYEESMNALEAWSPHDTGTDKASLAITGPDLRKQVR